MSNTAEPNILSTQETLLYFSEWLDGEGLIVSDQGTDKRSHEDLARDFIEHWEADDRGAILAGRLGARIGASLRDVASRIADALEGKGDRIPGL